MKKFVLLVVLMCPVVVYSEEPKQPPTQTEEPKLYEHYLSMQRMQEDLAARSPEEQARLQPQIQRAEREACQRLRRERHEGVPDEEYRQQGGDQFVAFAGDFERYCQTIQ
jgi:hypothetical protein